jgi:cell division transport system ATP-binding protein
MIDFEHVYKQYKGGPMALNDVNLHIGAGEFVFVLGHSGAGKSTLLKMILREEVPTRGQVFVDGHNVARLRRRQVSYLRRQMGIVFQDFRLIPSMTVYENVAFAMYATDIRKKEIKERVPYVLELVHLQDKAKVRPEFLSGGEQQRVAVARALVHAPKLVIADEPTGNIDPELSLEMMDLLERVSEMGITVLVVTHEHELVHHFNQRVITLKSGSIISDVPAKQRGVVR